MACVPFTLQAQGSGVLNICTTSTLNFLHTTVKALISEFGFNSDSVVDQGCNVVGCIELGPDWDQYFSDLWGVILSGSALLLLWLVCHLFYCSLPGGR